MTPEDRYLATVRDLQELAKRAPHVTQQDVLDIASMPVEELRRRAIVARDWRGHFSHSLDGITEISAMPGSGIDGCRSHKEVRAIVEQLVARCPYTWEDNCYGRLKAGPGGVPDTGGVRASDHQTKLLSGTDAAPPVAPAPQERPASCGATPSVKEFSMRDAVEELAQGFDGCTVEAVGGEIDVGEAIRTWASQQDGIAPRGTLPTIGRKTE